MKLEATNEIPGGLESEIARLRAQANAWEQVWAALMEHAPYGWRDFSKVGSESAINAIRSMAVSHGLQGYSGYVDAFYELAGMLGMAAQSCSPKETWETQMRPMVKALMELVEACEWHEIDEHGYAPAVAVSKALALVKKAKP